MRTDRSTAPGPGDGGALALLASCGMVAAVLLIAATCERLGTLVPMARVAATQTAH